MNELEDLKNRIKILEDQVETQGQIIGCINISIDAEYIEQNLEKLIIRLIKDIKLQ